MDSTGIMAKPISDKLTARKRRCEIRSGEERSMRRYINSSKS